MTRSDLIRAVHGCLPVRGTRNIEGTGVRQSDEYGSAEEIAAALFRADFERRYAARTLMFITQTDYKYVRAMDCPAIEFLLDMMKVHFRNWVSPRSPMREGGFRKPDGMGIAARGNHVTVELLEVKPYHSQTEGSQQMEDMLRRLRAGLNDVLRGQNGGGRGFGADDFEFTATEWRPASQDMLFPLLNPEGSPELVWACFASMLGRTSVGGVVLYEVHSMSFADADDIFRRIPAAIRQRITAMCDSRGWQIENGAAWQDAYCAANRADVQALKGLAPGADWAGLAAALALLLGQSATGRTRASAGRYHLPGQSSRPLSFACGPLTAHEPAIYEGVVLADAIRRH